MSRPTRIATAFVLALAVAVCPAVLEGCAASCAEHQDSVASTPSCHHVTTSATRIGHVPPPCSHDHAGAVVTWTKRSAPVGGSIDSLVAVVAFLSPIAPAESVRRLMEDSPPGASLALDARSLPLRI